MIFRAVAQEIREGINQPQQAFSSCRCSFSCGWRAGILWHLERLPRHKTRASLGPGSSSTSEPRTNHTTLLAYNDICTFRQRVGYNLILSILRFFFLFLPQRRRWDVESARQGPHAVFGPQAQLPSCKTITKCYHGPQKCAEQQLPSSRLSRG